MENVFIASMFSGSVWQIIGNSSAFGLFILLVLVIMSLVSWSVIFKKWRQFKAVEDANQRFIKVFRMARTLSEAMGQAKSQSASPVAHVFMAGHAELTELMDFKNEGGGLQQSVKPLDQDRKSVV